MCVLDEYRLIQQMQFSPILRKKSESYRAFCYRLKHTPQVIVADALLENKHVLQLRHISERRVYVYQCMNKFHQEKELRVMGNDMYTINRIVADAVSGKRVAVPTGGANYARFIKEKILEINPELNVGLYTKTETQALDVDVTTLWHEHNVIIYTPTILAGSSYLGHIDAVYALFITNTCGPDAGAQMMLRCRNAVNYYVCVKDTHVRKVRVPADVSPEYRNILMWLQKRERLYMTAKGEEDVVHAGLVHGTGEVEENYLRLYASYVQDEEKARRDYMFYLLIYLRDMGFRFEGLESETTDEDKEAINVTKTEYKEYKKEIADGYWSAKASAPEITHDEYKEIDKKQRKTEQDINKLDKYVVMKRYGVANDVITPDVMKQAKGNNRKHDNLLTFKTLSGIIDDDALTREMRDLYVKYLPTKIKGIMPTKVYNRPLPELTSNLIDGSHVMDGISREYLNMTEIEYKENMLCCMHAVNILRLLGLKDFMELYSGDVDNSRQVDHNLIVEYVDANWDEISMITKCDRGNRLTSRIRDPNEPPDKAKSYVNRAARKILDMAFGMSYSALKSGCFINVKTFKEVNGKIVLTAMDSERISAGNTVEDEFRRRVLNSYALRLGNVNLSVNAPQQRALVLNIVKSGLKVVSDYSEAAPSE